MTRTMRTIRTVCQTWTLADLAAEKPSREGPEGKPVPCEPTSKGRDAVDVATAFLRKVGAVEASSSTYGPGVFYRARLVPDYVNGTYTRRAYHPTGFTEVELRELHRRITTGENARAT